MLDFLSSKIAMVVAALVLLAAMAGFFVYLRAGADRDRFQALCQDFASMVNSAGALTQNHTEGVTYGENLPSQFGGDSFTVDFRPESIDLARDGQTASAPFSRHVHLYNSSLLGGFGVSSATVQAHDISIPVLTFTSGEPFCIETRLFSIDGDASYEVFVYRS